MVVLSNYFLDIPDRVDISIRDVKNYEFEGNKLTATVNGANVEVNFNTSSDSFTVKCSCGECDCIHIYKALLYRDIELNRVEFRELNKLTDNTPEFMSFFDTKNLEYIKDMNKFIDYLKSVLNFNIDRLINVHGHSPSEQSYLIQLHFGYIFESLKEYISKGKYNDVYIALELLYKYFFKMESIDSQLFYTFKAPLENYLNDIIKARGNVKGLVFDLILDLIQTPPYNNFIVDIYKLSKTRYAAKENLEKKEELSLILFDRARKNIPVKYEKLDNGYFKINREILTSHFDEGEYWYEYHLSVIKKLKYSDEELEKFYFYTRDFYLSRRQLKWRYQKTNQENKLIAIIKEDIEDPEISDFKRKEALREMKLYNPEYLESEEYLNTLNKLLFEDKIVNKKLIEDYTNLSSDWEEHAEELISVLELTRGDNKLLNKLYYRNYDKEKLLKNLEKEDDVKEFFKYEDFLMEDYSEKLRELMIKRLIDRKYSRVKYLDEYEMLLKHFKKYPEWKEGLKYVKRHLKLNSMASSSRIKLIDEVSKKHYTETRLDDYF